LRTSVFCIFFKLYKRACWRSIFLRMAFSSSSTMVAFSPIRISSLAEAFSLTTFGLVIGFAIFSDIQGCSSYVFKVVSYWKDFRLCTNTDHVDFPPFPLLQDVGSQSTSFRIWRQYQDCRSHPCFIGSSFFIFPFSATMSRCLLSTRLSATLTFSSAGFKPLELLIGRGCRRGSFRLG
jgi:hypothetical protein